jgi:hypothetical protein
MCYVMHAGSASSFVVPQDPQPAPNPGGELASREGFAERSRRKMGRPAGRQRVLEYLLLLMVAAVGVTATGAALAMGLGRAFGRIAATLAEVAW